MSPRYMSITVGASVSQPVSQFAGLAVWPLFGLSCRRPAGQSVGRPVGQSVGRPVGHSAGKPAGQPADWQRQLLRPASNLAESAQSPAIVFSKRYHVPNLQNDLPYLFHTNPVLNIIVKSYTSSTTTRVTSTAHHARAPAELALSVASCFTDLMTTVLPPGMRSRAGARCCEW